MIKMSMEFPYQKPCFRFRAVSYFEEGFFPSDPVLISGGWYPLRLGHDVRFGFAFDTVDVGVLVESMGKGQGM